MTNHDGYCVEFSSGETDAEQAGFDVCLAITTLELPLTVVVKRASQELQQKLLSLSDYGMAEIYQQNALTAADYQSIKTNAKFFLNF